MNEKLKVTRNLLTLMKMFLNTLIEKTKALKFIVCKKECASFGNKVDIAEKFIVEFL